MLLRFRISLSLFSMNFRFIVVLIIIAEIPFNRDLLKLLQIEIVGHMIYFYNTLQFSRLGTYGYLRMKQTVLM